MSHGPKFTCIDQAILALDDLILWIVKSVRTANQIRTGLSQVITLDDIEQTRVGLDQHLDTWWSGFTSLPEEPLLLSPENQSTDTTPLLLEVRWLQAKMWVNTDLNIDEFAWDDHIPTMRRIVQISRQAQSTGAVTLRTSRKFSFFTGFCPMLYWVVHKCRVLRLRAAALSLIHDLSWERETTWDRATLYGSGARIIEMEHDVKLTPEKLAELQDLDIDEEDDDIGVAEGSHRVRNFFPQSGWDSFLQSDGQEAFRRSICFEMVKKGGDGDHVLQSWIMRR
ncbi:hypothetical protein QQS21_010929 [Conoideocrella luteorostrata]|uniref:Uncharacterized protein n=1 Tax=Conoideocrella luteorostrata TaxID=1105319 RepID=A0AAJ0CED4_9HYPO|nr:hypothetical protein QQS21_010929 [Conoideocrella luteorostrata]